MIPYNLHDNAVRCETRWEDTRLDGARPSVICYDIPYTIQYVYYLYLGGNKQARSGIKVYVRKRQVLTVHQLHIWSLSPWCQCQCEKICCSTPKCVSQLRRQIEVLVGELPRDLLNLKSATPKRGLDLQWSGLAMVFFNQKYENICIKLKNKKHMKK